MKAFLLVFIFLFVTGHTQARMDQESLKENNSKFQNLEKELSEKGIKQKTSQYPENKGGGKFTPGNWENYRDPGDETDYQPVSEEEQLLREKEAIELKKLEAERKEQEAERKKAEWEKKERDRQLHKRIKENLNGEGKKDDVNNVRDRTAIGRENYSYRNNRRGTAERYEQARKEFAESEKLSGREIKDFEFENSTIEVSETMIIPGKTLSGENNIKIEDFHIKEHPDTRDVILKKFQILKNKNLDKSK